MKLSTDQIAELRKVQEIEERTHRACVPALEKILYEPIAVLDHGFIRVIDYMGDDNAIVQAARVSYGIGTKKQSGDSGLIKYLMQHRHTTPFEMCEIKFHVKLPIFVARQWIRHRTANVNEYSARYSVLDREFYTPDAEYLDSQLVESKKDKYKEDKGQHDLFSKDKDSTQIKELAAQSAANKQGREDFLDEHEAEEAAFLIRSESNKAYRNYLKLLNEEGGKIKKPGKKGLARELSRMILPINVYTQWYWKIDLHNLLHFLSLRIDEHAQYEIRAYAEKMSEIVAKWVPITYAAFTDYRLGAAHLSAKGLQVVKRLVGGESVTQADSAMSKREWRELMAVLGREE